MNPILDVTRCHGVRVRYDPQFIGISDSRGIWPLKRIFIGPTFLNFPPREQMALLLHEVGHCKLYHLEKRIARLWLLLRPKLLFAFCIEQEYEADRFVWRCGYAVELAQAFTRIRVVNSPLHPPVAERIARLLRT